MYMADDYTITDRSIIVRKIDDIHIHTYCLKRQQMRKCKRSNILAAGKAQQRRRLIFKQLSARQEKMLQFIDDYVSTKNYPPSICEIGDAVELKSPSTVKGHLGSLKGVRIRNLGTGKAADIEYSEKKGSSPNEIKCLIYNRGNHSMDCDCSFFLLSRSQKWNWHSINHESFRLIIER